MKRFLFVVLIICRLSSSGQDLKITEMVSLLDKSRVLFNKEFWKSATLYESFGKPVETLEKELLNYVGVYSPIQQLIISKQRMALV